MKNTRTLLHIYPNASDAPRAYRVIVAKHTIEKAPLFDTTKSGAFSYSPRGCHVAVGDTPDWKAIAKSIWDLVSKSTEPLNVNVEVDCTEDTNIPQLALELYNLSFDSGIRRSINGVTQHAIHIYSNGTGSLDMESWNEALAVAKAIEKVKQLVVTPPNDKYPDLLGRLLRNSSIHQVVTAQLPTSGFPLIEAVGGSSPNSCRVMRFDYNPALGETKVPHVVLVGKGISFDTGGLCLKPEKFMLDMKNDMTGAAMATTLCFLAAELKLPVKVTALVGLAENLLSGTGMRPSDVYTSRSGKTIEIADTDAEGRLVLADLLNYASSLEPTCIIDMATLTGSACVALGDEINTILSNSNSLWNRLEMSSKAVGEKVWRLPLEEVYRDRLDSKVADLKNYSSKGPDAIVAGLFLKEFITEGIDWAHIDLSAAGESADEPTAAGVRTLLELLKSF